MKTCSLANSENLVKVRNYEKLPHFKVHCTLKTLDLEM